MDDAVDNCYQVLGHVHNQPAPWQFPIPEMDFAAGADSHVGVQVQPKPSRARRIVSLYTPVLAAGGRASGCRRTSRPPSKSVVAHLGINNGISAFIARVDVVAVRAVRLNRLLEVSY